MAFETFLGNETAKKQLSAFIADGRFPHALLLEGPVGCGKKTLARMIAQAAVCAGGFSPEDRPCGGCSDCIKALAGSHPDITMVLPENDSEVYKMKRVREIREQAFLIPNEAEKRVIILCDAHLMREDVQNVLLRILEDPPAHLMFVLTCESRSQMLETIQSRTVCVSLRGVSADIAVPYLAEQCPRAKTEDIQAALTMFDGSIGQALESLKKSNFSEVRLLVEEGVAALSMQNELPLLEWSAKMLKKKDLTVSVIRGLRLVLRDVLAVLEGEPSRLSIAPKKAAEVAGKLTATQVVACMDELEKLEKYIDSRMNQVLQNTLLCARLRKAIEG